MKRYHGIYITADEEIFSIAGLYDQWVETSTGEILDTFSIITTDANDLIAEIHNSKKRMPVILDRKGENKMDKSDILHLKKRLSLLKPCPSEILKAHTISNLVNNKSANRNTPEVIRPFTRQNNSFY